jgi:hypothetical protein
MSHTAYSVLLERRKKPAVRTEAEITFQAKLVSLAGLLFFRLFHESAAEKIANCAF